MLVARRETSQRTLSEGEWKGDGNSGRVECVGAHGTYECVVLHRDPCLLKSFLHSCVYNTGFIKAVTNLSINGSTPISKMNYCMRTLM